jgi:hypothetical protein
MENLMTMLSPPMATEHATQKYGQSLTPLFLKTSPLHAILSRTMMNLMTYSQSQPQMRRASRLRRSPPSNRTVGL